MPYAQLHIREISAQNLPAYATTLFKRRLRLRNIKCKTILQRRKQPIILTSTSTSMRQAGDDGVYIMKDGSPVNASTNDDVVMISAVEEGTLNPVFRMLDPRPAQEASMVLTTTSSSSATEGAADEVAERGTSEASGGGKKRSLNFLLGPAPSLFTYNLELHDIFHSRLRIEFWDTNTEELLSFTVLKMRDIFEMDFGLHEFSESKELQESDIVIENEPKKESSLCSMSCFICFKWMSNLQVLSMTASQGSSPLPSPSAQGKTYQYENGAMKEGAKFGSLRLTARIDCSDFVIDLLKQPEINLVTVGFQIFLRIIQFSDPMELSRIPRPDVDVDSQGSPSSLCRVLQFDCLRALFDAPARFKSESLSMYRQLVLRLWAVLDAGAARLGLIFTKMLNPFGGHLSVMTDLEVVAPNIVLSTAELMSRLDPGPRFDALSADNLAAVTNLLKLIDPDSSKSVVVAETMTFRALQLLTTFAVQPDLPFSWRLRYLKHLTDNNVEKILAHHLLSYQDSDLGVDALDLCMALTSLVDEIVDTHMAVMPSAALKRTMSFVAEQDSESHKTRRLHIRQSLSAIAPTAVQEVTMPSMHSSKTSVSASLSQAKPVDTSSIDFILEENSDTAKVTTESGPTYSSPSSMVLSPNQRKQQLIKVNSEENILASEKRPRSNATWTIVGSQKPTDEKTREVLKTMEARSLANGSENARLIQRILFSEEFGLERLPMRLVSCKDAGGPTGMGSLLYPMTNMLEERGPPAKTANKHKANVHCLMEAGESFCLTHVVVAVGDLQCRQKNDVSSIAVFVSEQPITDLPPLSYQQLRAVSGYLNEQCPKLPQTDPPARSPIFVADMRPHRFVEIILPKPVHGRYVTLTMNPTSPADLVGDAPGHISIDHVAFIGWTVSNENNRAKPRRPHLELIGNVAYHVGITVPLDGGDIIQLAP